MFIAHNVVRMHDTDMAGIIYFPRQFRFAHDALEDFVETLGLPFDQVFHNNPFVFVVVHAESDYLAPLKVGDKLSIHLSVEKIGQSSFTIDYQIYKQDKTLAGKAKTVHVTLDAKSRTKVDIPSHFKHLLEKYLEKSESRKIQQDKIN